ncbi:MAG: T9SS type A sorting domain-containing protein [Tannerellaceae bacterium]|jgi:hypothetical protein|nr:T9SS type A sorting domain-containing protein [Tannerellaceae bacterium]
MRVVFRFLLAVVLNTTFSFALYSQADVSSGAAKKQATSPIEVIAVDNRIKVLNAPTGSRLEIYNVVGIKVADIEIKQPNGEYVVNIAKGYYIIRIGETVRKVAIR